METGTQSSTGSSTGSSRESRLQVRDLRAIVAVAEHASFARAADALWISRASMSEQVKRVEQVLGVRLFERTTRSVRPTPAGRIFVDHAVRVLAELDGLTDAVRAAGELTRGRIRLGLPAGVVNQRFWHALSSFHRDHPAVELVFTETSVDDLVRAVAARELDLSVTAWPAGAPPTQVSVAELETEPTCIAVAGDHPWATGATLPSADLATEPLVAFSPGFVLRTIAEDLCRRAGGEPTVALQTSTDETVAGLVRAQVGYAVTTHAHARDAGLTAVACEVEPLDRVNGLAWARHRALDPVTTRLRDRLLAGFGHDHP
ncbi:LysR family transcriptional regulator [Nocardioides sambongensis]|uniref:LysR family transcriptional regulator n=1 Tax=Nocardioides sambongensis TaxID=2589074 RepID=UPI0015E84038|nr:LysR family transcriptional regulator [Nocardioides sambongensis]